ncbi:MAG: 2,3-diphosphoglycerate-dependent phosphoglycerate mutase [Actinobacteria bacterium]|nr:2,3-diphosphoglycerate-dependent phosphoglycerate mutase [Actinomycetota bacterium]MCL5447525.1 2,3-diphosphoglycerate-dependent phosphoglycerate mutase [Actinomycetota bacterium]
MYELILLRHGESVWNAENLFTGWTDVDLSEKGEAEAAAAGRTMRNSGVEPMVVHTSVLTRSVRTANIALDSMERCWIPVRRHWRLNERHYGDLQGKHKVKSAETYGAEQVKAWRRGYSTPPPPLEYSDPRHPVHDTRYQHVAPGALPSTECLADVVQRMLPYFYDSIVPDIYRYGSVLVVAHGNSLRAMVKQLENIDDKAIENLNIPTGIPRRYILDEDMSLKSSTYLGDPEEIEAATEAVAAQATPGKAMEAE